ncbi:hypothetical protein CUJ86_08750 [Methanofollis fontis]|uniref:DUF5320 domain-containing protein n=1 Tax=Methanofollis fontis TaxID=2052832 RepID=A0A483CSD6_9EURY|nr:hypothetical protein CUJ86_08750 [Methanofollis fontis]
MPGFDGTGPRGMGPMTGRGLGRCRPAAPVVSTAAQTPQETTGTAVPPPQNMMYGVGRGGIPWGCGCGFCGGRGRGRFGGRGRW